MGPEDGETDMSCDREEMICAGDDQTLEPVAGPSWASNSANLTDEQLGILQIRNSSSTYIARPDLLLLTDAWGGHSSTTMDQELVKYKISRLQIPKHTTKKLQPLDVSFFRQYKKFWKRISETSLYQNKTREIFSRQGVINIHGLMWNQFDSPKYRDLLLWSWRKTGPNFSNDELENGHPPAIVEDIQFDLGRRHICGVDDCGRRASIRCSHCERLLCLSHFLERVCFHSRNETAPTNSSTVSTTPRPDHDDGNSGAGAGVGAAAGASAAIATGSITGAAIGAGSAAVGSAVVASGITIDRAGTDSASESHELEMVPLMKPPQLESVVVQMPPSSLNHLMRD